VAGGARRASAHEGRVGSLATVRDRVLRLGLVLLLVVSAGCGQTGSKVATTPGVSPSTSVSPTPTPLFAFPLASGVTCPDLRSLGLDRALLNAADANHPDRRDVILCDARDLAHPRSLKPLEGSTSQTFLGPDLVGYIALKGGGPSSGSDQFTSVPATLNLTTGQTAELASTQGMALAGGWSRDGSMVAYFTDFGGVHHYWLKRASGAPVAFSTPAQVGGRGGSPDDQLLVAFSPDGQYVLVVDTFVYRLQLFRTSDAGLAYAAPSGGAGGWRTMAVWAHATDAFYFRNSSGVYRWDPPSGISSFVSGLNWSTPSLTADDRFIAYALGTMSTPHVETRELSSGAVTAYPPWRDSPMFVAARTLLVHEEAPCNTCMGSSYTWTGKTLVVHTDTRAESDLGIAGWQFGAFWPHG
jgi:hypothetical protein